MTSDQANPGSPTGFVLVEERVLPDFNAAGRLYRHAAGAEVLSIRHDDPNRVFGIAFRTLPADSTGVAHILEHSALCGSKRYPERPFVELLKGSLHTFLNAMTFPDMTCYAVASTNEKDFRTLVDVYLDAVFFPTLTAETFGQEAWRIERAPGGALGLQGIVLNEMKGYFSSPRDVLSETLRRALFPDTAYSFGHGGDPIESGPDREAHGACHRRFYSPANALVFCSEGTILLTFGSSRAYLELAAAGDLAPPFRRTGHRHAAPDRATYPGARDGVRRDGFTAMGWALDAARTGDAFAWMVVDRLLVGSPTAPQRAR